MKIVTVKIKKFRCFDSIELDLEPLQALVGENGSGKTAILEAINLATSKGSAASRVDEGDFCVSGGDIEVEITFDQCFINQVPDGYVQQNVPCRKVLFKAHRRAISAGRALSDEYVVENYSVPESYEKVESLTLSDAALEIGSSKLPAKVYGNKADPTKYTLFRRSTGNPMALGPRLLSMNNELVGMPNIFYFSRDREREATRGFGTLLQRVTRELNWRFKQQAAEKDIIQKWEHYYDEVINSVASVKGEKVLDPTRTAMENILGQTFHDLELSLVHLKQPFTQSFFSRRRGGSAHQIPISNMGSGISILLAYYLLKTISEMSKEKIIFLIDEPELHLHPQLQSKMFEEFRNSESQTIFTTQSPLFIDISSWEGIRRFDLSFQTFPQKTALAVVEDGKKISDHLGEIKTWHQHETIYSKEDNEIFFARKCLLVEGPSEKYGIPRIAALQKAKLHQLTIISCNGKPKIPYYQLLCRAYNIPFFTLSDLDDQPNTRGENKRPHAWADARALIEFPTSFEELLGVESDHASDTLVTIDRLTGADSINKDILDAIQQISEWSVQK